MTRCLPVWKLIQIEYSDLFYWALSSQMWQTPPPIDSTNCLSRSMESYAFGQSWFILQVKVINCGKTALKRDIAKRGRDWPLVFLKKSGFRWDETILRLFRPASTKMCFAFRLQVYNVSPNFKMINFCSITRLAPQRSMFSVSFATENNLSKVSHLYHSIWNEETLLTRTLGGISDGFNVEFSTLPSIPLRSTGLDNGIFQSLVCQIKDEPRQCDYQDAWWIYLKFNCWQYCSTFICFTVTRQIIILHLQHLGSEKTGIHAVQGLVTFIKILFVLPFLPQHCLTAATMKCITVAKSLLMTFRNCSLDQVIINFFLVYRLFRHGDRARFTEELRGHCKDITVSICFSVTMSLASYF